MIRHHCTTLLKGKPYLDGDVPVDGWCVFVLLVTLASIIIHVIEGAWFTAISVGLYGLIIAFALHARWVPEKKA